MPVRYALKETYLVDEHVANLVGQLSAHVLDSSANLIRSKRQKILKKQAPKTFQGNEHQKIILKDTNVKKFTVTSTKKLFSKEEDAPKNIFEATELKKSSP